MMTRSQHSLRRSRPSPDITDIAEDQKGKGTMQDRKKPRRSLTKPSTAEKGGSSSGPSLHHPSVRRLSRALCAICLEVKKLSECSNVKNCSHVFCFDCISQYITTKVKENVTVIVCPQPGCKDGILKPEMCRTFLPLKVFDQWCTILCEALFAEDVRFYCPFKDCSALLINDTANRSGGKKGNVIMQSECPHCHRLFCAQCKVPWHADVTCDVFQHLGVDERGREDIILMEMAKKKKWQRCPKCKFFVEKTQGCMFISCRCGFHFCYGCGSQIITGYSCMKCKR